MLWGPVWIPTWAQNVHLKGAILTLPPARGCFQNWRTALSHTGTLPTSLLFDGKLRSGLQKRTRMTNPWYEQPLAWANLMAPLAGKTPKHHPWAPQASRGSEKSYPATASSGQPSRPRARKGPPSHQSRPGLGPFGRPWTSTGSLWGTRGTQKRRPPAHPHTTEI